jgi:hypothetical protein
VARAEGLQGISDFHVVHQMVAKQVVGGPSRIKPPTPPTSGTGSDEALDDKTFENKSNSIEGRDGGRGAAPRATSGGGAPP